MTKNRKYNFKDVDMLLASKTIVQNLSNNLTDLSVIRGNWTEAYTTGLSTRIDDAIDNYLGLDKKKELREASAKLSAIQTPAMRDVSFFKIQIEVDYNSDKDRRDMILKNLGIAQNLREAQKGSQEALIQLLYAIGKGMTDELKEEIIEKGTTEALIDRIINYASQLKSAEVSQETLKETTQQISAEAVQVLNEIYDEVVGICKIASSYYQDDSLMKKQFTFSKAVSNMNSAKSNSSATDSTETETA